MGRNSKARVALLLALLLGTTLAVLTGQELSDLLREAQEAMDSGRLPNAETALRKVLETDPDNLKARQALVDVLMRLLKWQEAEEQLVYLLNSYPQDVEVSYLAAAVAFRRGDFGRAVEMATQAIEQGNPSPEVLRIRALSRFMLQDYEGYIADLETLIERDPTNPDPHYHLGRYYYEKQLFTRSLDEFRKAVDVDPDHFRSHYFLGWCLQARSDLDGAEKSYRDAVRIIEKRGVRYGWPFTDLGDVLITTGKVEEGLQWLRKGTLNDPKLPYTFYRYASALFKTNSLEQIEGLLQTAVRLDPGYTDAYYLFGRYYQKIGDREKAKEAFDRFKELKANPVPSPAGVRR